MVKKYKALHVEEEYAKLLVNECVAEYLKNNPKMRGVNITTSKIFMEVVDYYLRT